ncbi:MAG: M56 family metallopeptidase, partial [Pirellulaceae bacterium]|nr:M56 family metallopeptidase [Pirellulaceae bacterium]
MSTALRPDEASCRQWRELLAGQGVKREIPLRLTEGMGPLLCRWPDGYELVVPAELWGSLGESARLGIMRHELAHYQRGDVWKSLAVRLLALPHWFNPAAWLAARRFEEAAEWACDEAAVAGHAPQTEYARTLLALAEASLGGGSCHPSMSRWNLSARVGRLLADSNAEDSIMKKLVLTGLAAVLVAFCLVRIDLVAKPNTDVAQPPSAVAETPNDAQRPGAVVLQDAHDSQQPGAVVLRDANDVQQPPPAVAKVGNDDPKPGDTVGQPDAKETTNPTRRALRYGGKTFEEWKQLVAKGVDQELALSLVQTFTAFGSRGYGREATEQILLLIRQHGPDPNKPESSPPMGMGGPMGPMMGPGGMAMGPAGPMGPMGESPESQLSKELIDRAKTAFIDGFGPGYGVIPRKESLPVLYRELREGNGKSIVFVLGLLDRIGERSPEATAALARLARSQPNADARDMAFLVLIKLDPSGDATADVLNELVNNNRGLPSLPASPFIRDVVLSTTMAEVVLKREIAPGYRGVLRVVERCLDHDKPGVRDWAIRHVADFLRDFHAESANAPMSDEDAKLVQRLMNRLILAYAESDLKTRPEILARLDSRSSTIGGLRGSTPAFDQIYSLIESAARNTDANLRRAAEELLRDLGPMPEPGGGMGMGGMRGGGMGGPMGGPAGGIGPGVGGAMPGMGPASEPPPSSEKKPKKPAVSRDTLRYQGKSFDQWKESLRTELSHDHRTEAIKALATFGANGYAKEATETILELMREHGKSFIDGTDQTSMMSAAIAAFTGQESRFAFPNPIPADAAVPILIKELKEGNEKSRFFVLWVLQSLKSEAAPVMPALAELLRDEDGKLAPPNRNGAFSILLRIDPTGETSGAVLREEIARNPTKWHEILPKWRDYRAAAAEWNPVFRTPTGESAGLELSPAGLALLGILEDCLNDERASVRDPAMTHLAALLAHIDVQLSRLAVSIPGVVANRLTAETASRVETAIHRLIVAYARTDDEGRRNVLEAFRAQREFVSPSQRKSIDVIEAAAESEDRQLRDAAKGMLEDMDITPCRPT